jgi:hypothetical protein
MTFVRPSSLLRLLAGTFLLVASSTSVAWARDDMAEEQAGPVSPATLAVQVAGIAHSSSLSRAKKEKRISTAVRIAVVSATAYKSDRGEILTIALSYTKAAASAAPHYAEAIANAVAFAAPLKQIDSAPGQIRTAAFAAAKNPHAVTGIAARKPPKRAAPAESIAAIEYPAPPAAESAPQVEAAPETGAAPQVAVASDAPMAGPADLPINTAVAETDAPKISLGSNTVLTLTAEAGARHDDNVFLTTTDKVADTIFSVTPGLNFRFGNASLAHGSLQYGETFLDYAHKSAANQALASASGDFGYNDESLAVEGTASYQQLYQNNRDVAALGTQTIFRSNVLDIMTSAESHLTAKTSFKGGLDYNSLDYRDSNLVGSRNLSVPLKVYYETTPKVAVSAGFTYQHIEEEPGGPSGWDLFYNLGTRGNFTEKLSGEISAGLHTREIGDEPRQRLWGFDGSLNYELSPKTSSALVLSRQFSTGAQGETLTNSSYGLKISNDPSLQWQLSAGLTYRDVQYDPAFVSEGGIPVLLTREDRYWEGNFAATFVFSYSLSLTGSYIYRHNDSNLPGAVFSNNIFSLMLDWRY